MVELSRQAFHTFKIADVDCIDQNGASSNKSKIQGVDGLTTVSCLTPSGNIIERPVVKKSGLVLHDSIKRNIVLRAHYASLILGQKHMSSQPFLLKCQRMKSASIPSTHKLSNHCLAPVVHFQRSSSLPVTDCHDGENDHIRKITIMIPQVDNANTKSYAVAAAAAADAAPVRHSTTLSSQNHKNFAAVEKVRVSPNRAQTTPSVEHGVRYAGKPNSWTAESRRRFLTITPLCVPGKTRKGCRASIGYNAVRGSKSAPPGSTPSVSVPLAGALSVKNLFPVENSNAHFFASSDNTIESAADPKCRTISARLYLRAPALKPLICTEEDSYTNCTECEGDECVGRFKACLSTVEYLKKIRAESAVV